MPTDRFILHIDNRSKKVTKSRTTTSAETVEERFAGMRAAATELAGPPLAEVMAVECDGCGRTVKVEEPTLPPNWTTSERGEFCEMCSAIP